MNDDGSQANIGKYVFVSFTRVCLSELPELRNTRCEDICIVDQNVERLSEFSDEFYEDEVRTLSQRR